MKLISWNVNGLRAVVGKGFTDIFKSLDADFFCIQETKLQEGQIELHFDGYESYFDYALRKGYSGTATFTKHIPVAARCGMGVDCHDMEGRIVTLDMGDFYLVNVYTPNSQEGLKRIDYRVAWERSFREYVMSLDKEKPVIVCGDLNVARSDIDLVNPDRNRGSAGYSDEERRELELLLQAGFVDTFRYLHPDATGAYTWWSYFYKARQRNAGWRIDYFLISERLLPRLEGAAIHSEIHGADHCPVELLLTD